MGSSNYNTDYIVYPVRAAAILTGSYVAGTVVGDPNLIYQETQAIVLVQFTIGNLTDGRIKIEFSPDNSTYYQESYADSFSSGVETDLVLEHKFTSTGNYRIPVPVKDRYIKISSKGTGDATSSSMKVDLIVATV